MSFWEPINGQEITGSGTFTIPNNTVASAVITKIEKITPKNEDYPPFYAVMWEIVSGDFAGLEVKQNLRCFHQDLKKQYKAKSMLKRLHELTGVAITYESAPDEWELHPLLRKKLCIRIQVWNVDGRTGNYVSEVDKADASEEANPSTLENFNEPDLDDVPF